MLPESGWIKRGLRDKINRCNENPGLKLLNKPDDTDSVASVYFN